MKRRATDSANPPHGPDFQTMAQRSLFSRTILFLLGIAGMAAGVLFLLGIRHLQARVSEISLGIGGISGGLAMLRIAMNPEPTHR
jgi:hypothetical protein